MTAAALAWLLIAAPTAPIDLYFFLLPDCPISNHFAPEISRVCAEFKPAGVSCTLVYVDPSLTDAAAQAHARAYRLPDERIVVDRTHRLVRELSARVTPEAIAVDGARAVLYRGRINDAFLAPGRQRAVVTRHDLREALRAITSGQRAPNPQTTAVGCFIADLAALAAPR